MKATKAFTYKSIIEAQNLSKTFLDTASKKTVGVGVHEGVSFSVKEGEIFGIIGPDGAGKTTLFRLLTSLYVPDQGRVHIAGWDTKKDYKAIRQHIGYMPGQFSLYTDLSIEENLQFFATIYNADIAENYNLIADIYEQILPFKKRKARALSGGMKQKLALCCALIHKPLLLFLDEPTTGIDPVSRIELWNMLKKLSKHGVSIVVSTAYMDEASRCDRVALMKEGGIVRLDTPKKLATSYPYTLFSVSGSKMIAMLNYLRNDMQGVISCYAFGDMLHLSMQKDTADAGIIEDHLRSAGFSDAGIQAIEPSLEDSFMALELKNESR